MRLESSALNAVASALPSCRVFLLLAGVLALPERIVLASGLFAAATATFAATLVVAAKTYRR
jgi:hypothetical protein